MNPMIVFLIVVLVIVFWCIRTANDFKRKEIRVQEGLSGVEVALTKRYDMLIKMMDTLSGQFFAVAENYPELRSSNVFVELQRGKRNAEEHLQAARRLYNSSVTAYNTAIAMFPAKLLTGSRQPKNSLLQTQASARM
ncbi:LemA family protein [Enterocloster citroniae]|uniref:LemA protein n=2 Tax=Enterocloster citroniae TaxID=358743 RepID=A0ABV2G4K3_9FIRM|nr:LemA family protein [Enterocloster citroniae]KMW10420.1 hypothetical protein HMPREF9470_05562 [[Clostridium] citroniae WAL-19142]